MKLQTKKIIAREFLLLMLAIGIGLIGFLCTYLYNSYQRNKAQKLSDEITTKESIADSLSKPFDIKSKQIHLLYEKFNANENVFPTDYESFLKNTWTNLSKLELKDNIAKSIKWDPRFKQLLRDVGFNSSEELQNFIEENRLTKDDTLNSQIAKSYQQEIRLLESKRTDYNSYLLAFKGQIDFGICVFCISLIILFASRYIYYAIKWSIKTLKQKQVS